MTIECELAIHDAIKLSLIYDQLGCVCADLIRFQSRAESTLSVKLSGITFLSIWDYLIRLSTSKWDVTDFIQTQFTLFAHPENVLQSYCWL